jgi:peptidoglycan/LPS O-acetylase OafA/YrhL
MFEYFSIMDIFPLLSHYSCILIGCILAFLLTNRVSFEKLSFLGRKGSIVSVLLIFVSMQLLLERWPIFRALYPFLVAILIICILLAKTKFFNFLSWRLLRYIGERSYGVYLLHLLCLGVIEKIFPPNVEGFVERILAYVFTVILSLLASEILFRALEKPFIDYGRALSDMLMARTFPKLPAVIDVEFGKAK